jgi:hypothetical protein
MKRFYTFLFVVIVASSTFAQVGINTETPDPSSALDISSTVGGLLPPRMTSVQRDNIVSPVEGLIVFCTDCGSGEGELQIKLSTQWGNLYNSSSGGGATKYLLRLEYDVNESLISANTTFVVATGFETTGASVVSQSANSGSNSGHTVTLNFEDTNPPTSITGYGWNPATGNYTVAAYDRDTKQVQYQVGIAAFTHQSTSDGASGATGQWGGVAFSGAGSYNIKIDVDQSALTYGNAVAGAFGNPSKLPHAYLVLTF